MDSETETDGGVPAAVELDELYVVVRSAVQDAILAAIEVLLLVAFALGMMAVGASVLFTRPSTGGLVVGLALILGGAVVAAGALRSGRYAGGN